MATQTQIQQGWHRLKEQWDDQGVCRSCSWHGLIYEHGIDDVEIEEALDGDGWLKLGCVGEDEDCHSHRGVKVFIGEPSGNGTEPL